MEVFSRSPLGVVLVLVVLLVDYRLGVNDDRNDRTVSSESELFLFCVGGPISTDRCDTFATAHCGFFQWSFL